jgi:hypothetical protein
LLAMNRVDEVARFAIRQRQQVLECGENLVLMGRANAQLGV